ncbi:MAG: NAD(P)-dependent glycerol-3-phosphate dehydrogenase [Alphaproteobacteria bacterium]|nr:NAD(P)-dependent glycerol-3-phosphate dehydrogenase [Alphaproteobacteria bacterium]
MQRIGIIGGGAWGAALALVAARAGRTVALWARDPAAARAIAERGESAYLPGVRMERPVAASTDLAATVGASDALLLAVPAQPLATVLAAVAERDVRPRPLVLCAKGIEAGTGSLLSEVVARALPGWPIAVLSGPTFAAEVARGLPTAVTLACADPELGARLAAAIGSAAFRPYLATDLIGAEVGGAVKNVLAIAAGIAEGRRLGANARAALVTRGLAEIVRLAVALGGRPETLAGLAGVGDVMLTCSSVQSRNFAFGLAVGEGRSPAEALALSRGVVEGVATASAVAALARRQDVEMPIAAAVDGILNRAVGVDAAIRALLERPLRAEPT